MPHTQATTKQSLSTQPSFKLGSALRISGLTSEQTNNIKTIAQGDKTVQMDKELKTVQTQLELVLRNLLSNKRTTEISPKDLRDIIDNASLSRIAESLDDNFMSNIQQLLETNTTAEFSNMKWVPQLKQEVPTTQNLNRLYKQSQANLNSFVTDKKHPLKSYTLEDILLTMYTQESAYIYQMNRVMGNYRLDGTTDEQMLLSMLLNVATYKAALNKGHQEIHQQPGLLLRGTGFGEDAIKASYKTLQQTLKSGDLDKNTLLDCDLAQSLVTKKIVSSTSKLSTAQGFAGDDGFIIEILNPQDMGVYCDVSGISKFPGEKEFVTRSFDNIALIPVGIKKDTTPSKNGSYRNVYEMMVIRSNQLQKQHSNQQGHQVEQTCSKINKLKSTHDSQCKSSGFFSNKNQNKRLNPQQEARYDALLKTLKACDLSKGEMTEQQVTDIVLALGKFSELMNGSSGGRQALCDQIQEAVQQFLIINYHGKVHHHEALSTEQQMKKFDGLVQGLKLSNIENDTANSLIKTLINYIDNTAVDPIHKGDFVKTIRETLTTLDANDPQINTAVKQLEELENTIDLLGKATQLEAAVEDQNMASLTPMM